MSATIAVKFKEYTTHGHDLAVTNEQSFYDHEIRKCDIHPGTQTIVKRTGNGRPIKIVQDGRFGRVLVTFKIWDDDTIQKIANLRALADVDGRLRVFPSFADDATIFRVVTMPDEEVLDNILMSGFYSRGDEIALEFQEVEHHFPLRQVLFRTTEGNNLLSTTDGTQLKVVQVDAATNMIRLNKLPNVLCLFEPDAGKEWALQSNDDIAGADPTRSGDYTSHLKVKKHATYSAQHLYSTGWLQIEEVGTCHIEDFSVNEEVCLINPFVGHHNTDAWIDGAIVEEAAAAWRDDYVSAGGAFKHTDGDWVLLVNGFETSVGYSVGSFKGASLDALTVQNSDAAHFVVSGTASNWRETQIFASCSPIWLPDENKYFIICNGYSGTDTKWRIGWVKFDEDFTDIEYATAEIVASTGSSAGMYAASIVQHKGKYIMGYIDRGNNANPESATGGWKLRWAVSDTITGTYVDLGIIASGRSSNDGLWRSCHVDASSIFVWKGELYLFVGGTSWYANSGTRGNRAFGIFRYDEGTQAWVEDTRNPVFVNPAYGNYIWDSDYAWAVDHVGGYFVFYPDTFARKLYLFHTINSGVNAYRVGYVYWDLQGV